MSQTPQGPLDPSRRYLVPVAHLDLPGEPDLVHLSLYEWLSKFEEWATGWALCGTSAEQGALPAGTVVTCPDCERYRPKYQATLDAQHKAADERARRQQEQRQAQAEAGNTVENGAWHTVWLESGKWRWTTSKMTLEQREYAANCVAAYSRHLATWDVEPDWNEPEDLRWWRSDR